MTDHDEIQTQAIADAAVALAITKKIWDGTELKPTPDAFQASFATALIHIQTMRLTVQHA